MLITIYYENRSADNDCRIVCPSCGRVGLAKREQSSIVCIIHIATVNTETLGIETIIKDCKLICTE